MDVKTVSIDSIKPYPNNPRINDNAVDKVANSIKEFGFQQPIVVDKDGVVIVGHTRLKAAKKLGLKEVPVVYAVNLSEEKANAYRLADNKTGEFAEWDDIKLEDELNLITDIDMADFGFEDLEESPEEDAATEIEAEPLANKFLVPPFSIINLTKGEIMSRKKVWDSLILDDGTSRGGATTYSNDSFNKEKYNIQMKTGTSLMNPVVCEIINRWFLPTGKEFNTFDCFSGDTAFGFVSSYLGNKFTGIELRQQQVNFNQSRIDAFNLNAKYICDDGQNVAQHLDKESQDLLFSCPPYFDLEVYSDLENDASNQNSYSDFLKILDNAFTNACSCLKNNRFACIVVGNIRDNKTGYYYDFVGDIVRIFEKAGLHYYNDIVLQTPVGTGAFRANRYMRKRKVVKIHQNLLVFYKGNNQNDIPSDFDELKDISDSVKEFELEDES